MRDSFSFGASNGPAGLMDDSNGLGNLADELAEAWDDYGGGDSQIGNILAGNGAIGLANRPDDERRQPMLQIHHDMSIPMPNIVRDGTDDDGSLSSPKQPMRSRHQEVPSDYDGSDYDDQSDLENVDGMSASLEHHLAAIESLACRGSELNGSGADTVIMRVAESLRDLGSQVGVEAGASRLTTIHTAVTSSLAHQTRLVQKLSHHFISPYCIPPTPDEVDELLPLLVATLELLPQANLRAVSALHSIYSSAAELVSTLSVLADSLHMIRQTISLASRKLKAAKDVVDELSREAEIREEGMWLVDLEKCVNNGRRGFETEAGATELWKWQQDEGGQPRRPSATAIAASLREIDAEVHRHSHIRSGKALPFHRMGILRLLWLKRLNAASINQDHRGLTFSSGADCLHELDLNANCRESTGTRRRTRRQPLQCFEKTEAMIAPLATSSECQRIWGTARRGAHKPE
ncbi:MAG: hypothetical protein Q9186_005545 [Xanthomendoza sp. 1 TL-2023]